MPSLRKNNNGAFIARVRVPKDVQEEYGRLYGKRHEAKFFAPADTKTADAKRRFGEWLAEHEARVASIRAERNGEGRTLSQRSAAVLAAEWYRWFVARHQDNPGSPMGWEVGIDDVGAVVTEAIEDAHRNLDHTPEYAIEAALPLIADRGETQQFLAHQRETLNHEAQALFLRAVYDQFFPAVSRIISNAEGNYSIDRHAASLPPAEPADPGESPWQLFEAWVKSKDPAASTVETWRYILRDLSTYVEDRSAGSMTAGEARAWLESRVTPERSARTVAQNWRRAAHTVFEWAKDAGKITTNPFSGIKLSMPRKGRKRDEKSFRAAELATILRAASAIPNTKRPDDAAKRWVPWLLAYSGARPSEITQLRGADVLEQDGVPILRLTPDAGSIKNKLARSVPIHEHLLEQGFVRWAKERGEGPLFYKPRAASLTTDKLSQKKSPAAQVRQRLAEWVRSLGVSDPELSPNHAWRHTFKVHGRRVGISEKYLDDICGHAPPSEGRSYGPTPLIDKAAAMAQFPRYILDTPTSTK